MKIATTGLFLMVVLMYSFYFFIENGYFGHIPTSSELREIVHQETTEVLDTKGKIIGKFYIQDRNPVSFAEISEFIIQALIATEDRRFYEHEGVDPKSLARVFFKSILGGKNTGGGSTITQQLAKNLYPRQDVKYFYYPINKTKEIVIAKRLELEFSKEEIIELYLNTVSFGSNVYGIETAAKVYFEKMASELTLGESATLVGMLKATTSYHPVLHPMASVNRRNLVLLLMKNQNKITENEYQSAIQNPLVTSENWKEDNRSYFLTRVQKETIQLLNDYNKLNGSHLNLFTSGLKIKTTIDWELQRAAELAVHNQMKSLQKLFDSHWGDGLWKANSKLLNSQINKITNNRSKEELNHSKDMLVYTPDGSVKRNLSAIDSLKYYLQQLHAGFVSIDPGSGRILAWVGGINNQYFPYDHVNVAAKRQVGSTFKPIVYASALEAGIDPCKYYDAEKVAYDDEDGEWTPSNSDGNYEGVFTLEQALESSVNTVSVKIINDVGIANTILLANAMGIESKIPVVPSIALGTPSISLIEMVGAYSVFVNNGFYLPPYMIEEITDADEHIIYKYAPADARKAMSKKTAIEMTHFLKNVIENGTGSSMRTRFGVQNDMGGKTGTTQSNADGWFISITPNMVTGCWVGGAFPAISFRETSIGQGATMALPIVGNYFQEINKLDGYDYYTKARFAALPADIQAALDCDPFEEELNFFERLFGKRKKKIGQT